jgi:hypothetical protein
MTGIIAHMHRLRTQLSRQYREGCSSFLSGEAYCASLLLMTASCRLFPHSGCSQPIKNWKYGDVLWRGGGGVFEERQSWAETNGDGSCTSRVH